MINKAQFTKMQNKSDKLQAKPETGRITPISPGVTLDNKNSMLKELRRPRSRKYIQNLIELRELLLQLDEYRRRQADEAKYGMDNVSGELKYGNDNVIDDTDNSRNMSLGNMPGGNNPSDAVVDNTEAGGNLMREYQEEKYDAATAAITRQTDYREAYTDSFLYESARENEINTAMKDLNRPSVKDPVIEELEKRIEEKLEQLGKENPQISRLLTIMYMSDKEEYLIECGVIRRTGTPMYSREDAAAVATNAEEAERLKRGYDILLEEQRNPNFLTLEVYTDAYCVIFMDGVVKTIA